jgi:hypothetical protein
MDGPVYGIPEGKFVGNPSPLYYFWGIEGCLRISRFYGK